MFKIKKMFVFLVAIVLILSVFALSVSAKDKDKDPRFRNLQLKAPKDCIKDCGKQPKGNDYEANVEYQMCIADCHPKIDFLHQSIESINNLILNIINLFSVDSFFDVFVEIKNSLEEQKRETPTDKHAAKKPKPAKDTLAPFPPPQRILLTALGAINRPFSFLSDGARDILGIIALITCIISIITAALMLLWW